MEQQIAINEQISVGGQPTEDDLKQLAGDGFKTIVNLRTEGEEGQPLTPAEEGKQVRKLGLGYVHFPVDKEKMGPELEDEFRDKLPTFAAPVFVHCSTGKRAGAFVVMDKAIEEGWSGDDTLDKAKQMGFECEDVKIKDFVRSYVDSRA